MTTQPIPTPKRVKASVAHADGYLDQNTKATRIMIEGAIPAKDKSVDWQATAERLGEQLLTSRELCEELRKATTRAREQAIVDSRRAIRSDGLLETVFMTWWLKWLMPSSLRNRIHTHLYGCP